MGTIALQTSTFAGLNYTLGAASTADKFLNDGYTMLIILNTNVSTRTLTIAANDARAVGFGNIVTPDSVITVPATGTNGGRQIVGPFPPDRFNDADGYLNYTLSSATDVTVAAVKMPRL